MSTSGSLGAKSAVETNTSTSPSSAARPLRAPAYNPYEKFTQPDFDAWIGDITGVLRRALEGNYEEPSRAERREEELFVNGDAQKDALLRAREDVTTTTTTITTTTTVQQNGAVAHGEEESSDDGDILEDSFAHVKARRKAKGKGRDPREGPGFGTRVEVIEGIDDEEDDEEQEEQDEDEEQEVLEISSGSEEEEDGEPGEYDEEDYEGEGAYDGDDGVGRLRYDDEEDDEEAEQEYYEDDEDGQEDEEEDDQDLRATQSHARAGPSSSPIKSKQKPQVYELLDSDEEEDINKITSSPPAPEQHDDAEDEQEQDEDYEGLFSFLFLPSIHRVLLDIHTDTHSTIPSYL